MTTQPKPVVAAKSTPIIKPVPRGIPQRSVNKVKRTYLSKEKLYKRRDRKLLKVGSHDTVPAKLPASASIQTKCPAPYDQGQLGSCTANAFAMCYRLLETDKSFLPSRLYFYFYERLAEDPKHNPADLTDSGGDVADGLAVVQQSGVCSEGLWPYNPANLEKVPTAACQTNAALHKISSYRKLDLNNNPLAFIKNSICYGSPVLIAIGVYQSFESDAVAQTGTVPMPNPVNYDDPNDQQDPFLGGHEVTIVGYDDASQRFTLINSWGQAWGAKGFFTLPYAYVTNQNLTFELEVMKLTGV